MGLRDAILSLGSKINSVESLEPERKEGVIGDKLPELSLEMDEAELSSLSKKRKKAWDEYYGDIKKRTDKAINYWKGTPNNSMSADSDPQADNLIFEATETFLPMANKQNPEPMVDSDDTEEGRAFASKLQKMLVSQADRQVLALKLQKGVRNWLTKLVGVWKIGWNAEEDDIETIAVDPKHLILDKDAWINEKGEYQGEFIGEMKEDTASTLIARFPEKAEFLTSKAGGPDKLGTKLGYIEWWTKKFTYTSLDNEILTKSKNYHFNYESTPSVNESGQPIELPPKNHFKAPKMPYVFLSVFSMGEHPHDDTSLIEQNISNQDRINKRTNQIDKSADRANGGVVLDSNQFDKDQAAAAVDALRKGLAILAENPSQSVVFSQANSLPSFVYDDKEDARRELRNIFGTSGSSAQGIKSQDTARGKILAKGSDDSRVGGGVTKYIEQVADSIFNWWAQMMCVYYTEEHYASVLGESNTKEYISLKSSEFRTAFISVKEGSLVPNDELTRRNEALDLWTSGAIDPIELFSRLKFPDPKKAAQNLYLWQNAPQQLFPELAQMMPPAMPVPQEGMDGGQPQPTTEQPPELQGMPMQDMQQGQDPLSAVPIQ